MPGIPAYSYVRMSTEGQLKGDSRRRQLELSSRYASEHGLDLITGFDLADYGVSAFKGQNVSSGALGRFLEAVRTGKVAKGAYLLVESLDRLSRQKPQLALPQFLEIVNQGIVLVTLADGRKYTAETVKLEDLLYSLVVMSRAHEESQMKSQRISAAWANKRRGASDKKLTGKCPLWLRLKANGKSFEILPDRVQVIRRIFDEAKAGMGGYAIARRLNADKVPAFRTENGWHKSSIDKLLTGRAVLGEFQPHRLIDGKRVPDGEVVLNYFPPIIPQDIYDAAQAQRLSKKTAGGGRQGERVSNLFSKIARCAYCGGPMRYENKGAGSKGGQYLACDNAIRGNDCIGGRWKYEDLEASFLAFVEEVDLGALIDSDGGSAARASLEDRISALQGRLSQVEVERENAYRLIEQRGINVDFVGTKLRACEEALIGLSAQIKDAQAELSAQAADVAAYYQSRDNISALVAGIGALDGKDGYKVRTEIASKLRTVIASLEIGPLGTQSPERLEGYTDEAMRVEALPFFKVTFKDGTIRTVAPSKQDPLNLELMMHGPKRSRRAASA